MSTSYVLNRAPCSHPPSTPHAAGLSPVANPPTCSFGLQQWLHPWRTPEPRWKIEIPTIAHDLNRVLCCRISGCEHRIFAMFVDIPGHWEHNFEALYLYMHNPLIQHFNQFISIDVREETEVMNYFRQETYAKKINLLTEDAPCKFHFFVVKGCVRMFFLNEKGVEQTTQFAIENWWITDYLAFDKQTKSKFTIQAIEKTEVLQIDYDNQEKLLHKFPILERYFRLIYQRAYSASQFRTRLLYDYSREDFYHHFNNHFPEFTQRVPQHILASYLNMTPEYLSEIKKKSRT